MAENLEGYGLDPIWWWVFLAIEIILKLELDVYLTLNFEVGVWFPHSGKRLSNKMYGVLNYAVSYLISTGGEEFCMVLS